jgi:hypothetical protein
MKNVFTGGTCTAAVLAFSLAAFAQTGQTGTTQSQAHGQHGDPNQQMTLVGCVQTEADYRAARNAGSGGVVGTGVGVGNEFVLVNATMSHAKGADAASGSTTGATTGTATGTGSTTGTATGSTATGSTTGTMTTPGQTTGTSGSTAMGDAYELTGPSEGQLAAYVGRRVEITGRLKAGAGGAAAGGTTTGTATGTTTSGTASGTVTGGTVSGTASASGRPQTGGMDVLGQDLKLREFEVISVRAVEGTCPANPQRK